MIIKALLFLLAGTMIYLTGTARIEKMSGLIRNYPLLGWLFFIAMLRLLEFRRLVGLLGRCMLDKERLRRVRSSYLQSVLYQVCLFCIHFYVFS